MTYTSNGFALLAAFTLAFSISGFSSAVSLVGDDSGVTRVALSHDGEKGEGKHEQSRKNMKKKHMKMCADDEEKCAEMKAKMKERHEKMHEKMKGEMKEMDREEEKDNDND